MSTHTAYSHIFSGGPERFVEADDNDRTVLLRCVGQGRIGYSETEVATTSDGFLVMDDNLSFTLEAGQKMWAIRHDPPGLTIDVLTTMVR